MKNLHNIQDNSIPEWAKRLILAWSSDDNQGATTSYYFKDTDKLSINSLNYPRTEEEWADWLGWKELMNEQDVSKFLPNMITII